ncbi:putative neprosin [Arabidopsis thaliana]
MGGVFVLRKPRNGNKCRRFDRCITMRQTETELFSEETRMRTRETRRRRRSFFLDMILLLRTCSSNILFLSLLLLSSSFSSVLSENLSPRNQTLRPLDELNKLKAINQHLRKINKPSIKTIHSPDGDIIDCVLLHHQPAFDHPSLRGQKPLDPPERPRGHNRRGLRPKSFQLWGMEGETCPEGTVPIRRTKEEDILRANSVSSFGKKLRHYRRDTSSNGHEHAVGYVSGEKYYGAKASINVWAPQVQNQYEFSLSQIWIISGSFGNDLNTIEAGWQVSPELYGDNYPRFFTYWTFLCFGDRTMHIKQQVATISCVPVLSKPIVRLRLELPSLPRLHTRVDNSILLCLFGRIRSMGIGGWNSGRVF